jgi:hypothetical protein
MSEKIYYKLGGFNHEDCLTKCKHENDVKVGSAFCKAMCWCKEHNEKEQYVICDYNDVSK